jgi:hypothetical protein
MACVLTVVVVKNGTATIGHVGDTRLYKLGDGRIEKITRDHSPVGEQEDAQEISELEAMRHPRRNEVYRDVGSEPHEPGDPDFVELHQIPFGPDEALLLCSDGLTDLVDSGSILRTVAAWAGDPPAVVRALIDAANDRGGKDNVTAVYVEGRRFAALRPGGFASVQPQTADSAALLFRGSPALRRWVLGSVIGMALALSGVVAYRKTAVPAIDGSRSVVSSPEPRTYVVQPHRSIAEALSRAQPGSEVTVEPGEYFERVVLDRNVRLVSRVPRGATIRLPATDSDTQPEPAVVAMGSAGGALVGFRIVGDARTPLGVGILVMGAGLSLSDIEVSGATTAAVSFARDASATLSGSDIHDNPGAALDIRTGATPRITHNLFGRNSTSPNTAATFTVEEGAMPVLQHNTFLGLRPGVFRDLDGATRLKLEHENWFVPLRSPPPPRRAVPRGPS